MRPFNLLIPFLIASDPNLPPKGGSTEEAPPSAGQRVGRVSEDDFRLTPEQIETFHRDGCVTIPNVLTEEEVLELEQVFDRFLSGDIAVPAKDFCDMSKPFGIPPEEWSIVNCMLPTTYYPPFRNNIYERITQSMARQLFPDLNMTKDYDQLLNKRPNKDDAVFAWHQDMGYWPGPKALNVSAASTCTFSLAIDDSTPTNGCLRYIPGSGKAKTLRSHAALSGSRDEGHALTLEVGPDENVQLAPASRGSLTIHDEYVVHGSGGNNHPTMQRRTYVVAYRPSAVVQAERKLDLHIHTMTMLTGIPFMMVNLTDPKTMNGSHKQGEQGGGWTRPCQRHIIWEKGGTLESNQKEHPQRGRTRCF